MSASSEQPSQSLAPCHLLPTPWPHRQKESDLAHLAACTLGRASARLAPWGRSPLPRNPPPPHTLHLLKEPELQLQIDLQLS